MNDVCPHPTYGLYGHCDCFYERGFFRCCWCGAIYDTEEDDYEDYILGNQIYE